MVLYPGGVCEICCAHVPLVFDLERRWQKFLIAKSRKAISRSSHKDLCASCFYLFSVWWGSGVYFRLPDQEGPSLSLVTEPCGLGIRFTNLAGKPLGELETRTMMASFSAVKLFPSPVNLYQMMDPIKAPIVGLDPEKQTSISSWIECQSSFYDSGYDKSLLDM